MKNELQFAAMVGVFIALCASQSLAQAPRTYGRYQPSKPVISPYFNYNQINTVGIPNYYMRVQPEFQRRVFAQNQVNYNQYQQARLGYLQQQLQQPAAVQGGGPLVLQQPTPRTGIPSTAATFLNRSHYYPLQQQFPQKR